MQTWVIYAIISMLFAGITSILAKYGLQNITADFGLGVRTTIIFLIISILNIVGHRYKEFNNLTNMQLFLLLASGVASALSWIFYYRAIKDGPVSYVASIDKASILITLLFSFFLLKEPMTPKVILGGCLIFAGTMVLIWK